MGLIKESSIFTDLDEALEHAEEILLHPTKRAERSMSMMLEKLTPENSFEHCLRLLQSKFNVRKKKKISTCRIFLKIVLSCNQNQSFLRQFVSYMIVLNSSGGHQGIVCIARTCAPCGVERW
jgi:hypothetical protein